MMFAYWNTNAASAPVADPDQPSSAALMFAAAFAVEEVEEDGPVKPAMTAPSLNGAASASLGPISGDDSLGSSSLMDRFPRPEARPPSVPPVVVANPAFFPTQDMMQCSVAQLSSFPGCSSRRVSFAPLVRVFSTIGVWELTDQEVEATWATVKDKKRCQLDVVRTVKTMRAYTASNTPLPDDDNNFCRRGLEHLCSSEHHARHKANRSAVISIVLREQQRQWLMKMRKSLDIATVSMSASMWSRACALAKAEGDAQIAGTSEEFESRRMSFERCAMRRRRSSRLSFEKHHGKIFEQLEELAEEEEAKEGKSDEVESDGKSALSSSTGNDLPVISKIEGLIIDKEVKSGNLTVDENMDDCDNSGGANASTTNASMADEKETVEYRRSSRRISFKHQNNDTVRHVSQPSGMFQISSEDMNTIMEGYVDSEDEDEEQSGMKTTGAVGTSC